MKAAVSFPTRLVLGLWACIVFTSLLDASAVEEEEIEEPRELTRLRADYEKAVERAHFPIQDRYRLYLEKLRDKFTRENKLDEALAIRDELRKVEELIKQSPHQEPEAALRELTPEESLELWLQDREFSWKGTNGEVTVHFEGKRLRAFANGRQLLEEGYRIVSPSELQFAWTDGETNTFTITGDRRGFTRAQNSGGSLQIGEIRQRPEPGQSK